MDERDFEGTLVLEQLARIDKVEEFFEAIDNEDPRLAAALMREATSASRATSTWSWMSSRP